MSEDIPKKKRFEGLVQFSDPFRQALVCLQASMGRRFQTENDSTQLKALNQGADGGSYFLISSEDSSEHASAPPLPPVLCRLAQIPGVNAFTPRLGRGSEAAQLTAWIDASDGLGASYLIQLMAMAASSSPVFDLEASLAPGGYRREKSASCSAKDFIDKEAASLAFCTRRKNLMRSFVERVESLYSDSTCLKLISDGVSVGLLVEGTPKASEAELPDLLCKVLGQADFPLVIANWSKDNKMQCLLMTPVRLPLVHNEANLFKGLILCRNLRPAIVLDAHKRAS